MRDHSKTPTSIRTTAMAGPRRIKVDLPKRFYKDVGVGPVDGGFTVTLDGRPTKTPGHKCRWSCRPRHRDGDGRGVGGAGRADRSRDHADGAVGQFGAGKRRATIPAFRDEIIKFAGDDLLLYRAETPTELVAEQEAMWDAALVTLARHFGVGFQPTIGIIHQPQPAATLARLYEALPDEDLLALTALNLNHRPHRLGPAHHWPLA